MIIVIDYKHVVITQMTIVDNLIIQSYFLLENFDSQKRHALYDSMIRERT
jgi:hypothetical protein